ncbi:CCA tRNA nucleotidyltransferase [Candidatus Micrarchaeota archaeon]|nr:CCA tRNA nucleotidyltransferase [Candidatus Micrarchaeota archaeon]
MNKKRNKGGRGAKAASLKKRNKKAVKVKRPSRKKLIKNADEKKKAPEKEMPATTPLKEREEERRREALVEAKVSGESLLEKAGEEKRRAIEELVKRVSSRVTPSQKEEVEEKDFASNLIRRLAAKLGEGVRINFVGSAARDTGLKGDRDIDLFVAYPKNFPRVEIIKKTFNATKKAIRANWILRYAEHPYLQARINKFKVEVIPCFQIEPHEEIRSAVDRSPLHMDYLQKHLTEEQRRDVRVLKQFLKNADIYGAEAEVEGFSGLVCEYLMLNYRSFQGVVENAAEWKPPEVIDIEGVYEDWPRGKVLEKFGNAPLILIDVIDKNRNTTAAVCECNAAKFISLCRAFLEKPSEKFFFRKKEPIKKEAVLSAMAEKNHYFLLMEITKPDVIEDILFPQLRKTAGVVARQFELNEFKVFEYSYFVTEKHAFILVELEGGELPPTKKLIGPPVSDPEAVKRFLKAHKRVIRGPWLEGARVAIEEKRILCNARELVGQMKHEPMRFGVASHFKKAFKRAKIGGGKGILNGETLQGVGSHVLRKEFWW